MEYHETHAISHDLKIPKIIYGTAWKKDKTASLVSKAIELGFRGLDTACQPKHYFEPGVGKALSDLKKMGFARDEIFLQTKYTPYPGQDPKNVPYDPSSGLRDQVLQSFSVSLKNLGTDYLDSLVLHSPLNTFDRTIEVWNAMEEIHERSGAKVLGISNCYDLNTLKSLYETVSVKPTILQNRFYQETDFDKDIRKWCLEKNIVYQSFWTLSANQVLLANNDFQSIANQYTKTAPQILFRFLTQIGVAPLTGTTSETHMQEDLSIFDFELSSKHLNQIHGLL